MTHRVFLDSNVLASRTLRDWVLLTRMNTGTMFQLHTTLDVIAETIRAVRKNYPRADGGVITEIDRKIRDVVDELVDDFAGDVCFVGRDEHDRHVNAAATHAEADILVTDNPRDFGDPALLPYDIYTADEFLCLVDDGAQADVRRVVQMQNDYWQTVRQDGRSSIRHASKPPKGIVAALVDAGCVNFAARVEAHLQVLNGSSR
ncbi:PIN domain-containing protein [Subtercola boreus]|uniref:Uncharacterized protein n=1 Tax=Subtercola boreus TaxID=120213 RepID=A0A3E0W8F8_9MICO|nr:PIN domain-containing protein [Subtercola boreus]RFA18109.1 hypothetical protein B7R24_15800 [Subtercola boreus]RFA18491.1 hypothetical protein B7R23_15835 [Subtercola boreus]RFA25019.1 hypothetical protein B7R25_15830 [Subtercola boreus]